MTLSETKCVQCEKSFEPRNKRNIYCSDGCKQEAYRIRNNIESPNFLKNDIDKFHVFKSEDTTIVYRDVYTREYTDKQKKIRELNLELSKYKKEEKGVQDRIDRILDRNDSFFTKRISFIITTLTAMVAGWAIYGLIKTLMAFKLARWILFPFIVLAVIGGLLVQRKSDSKYDEELLNVSKYRADLEGIKVNIKSLELVISNEELMLASINQFERLGEAETIEIIEKVKQPKGGFPKIRENDAKDIMSLKDLQKARFKILPLTGVWRDSMGTPSEGFSVMIYGQSGQGKSTFAINFSEYLANNFGAVLYNSAEEGINLTLQDKMKNLESDDLFISHQKDFNSMKRYLKNSKCKFVVLDSVNHMNLTPDNVEGLRNMDKTRSFISIHQVTKTGDFKGDNKFLHNCDTEIVVDKYIPITKKCRFKITA